MKIYTRTGDAGETALFDGTRVSKADARVDAYGEIDELNAALGLARAGGVDEIVNGHIVQIQRDLHAVGARLADPQHRIAERVEKASVTSEHVERLEAIIDDCEPELPPLRHFILAGGSPAGAALHLARTICRRAERRIVSLGPEAVEPCRPGLREPAVGPAVRARPLRQPPGRRARDRVVDIDAAYAHCARLARAHYENFPVASWLLPRHARPSRGRDLCVRARGGRPGRRGNQSPEERLAALARWRRLAARGG